LKYELTTIFLQVFWQPRIRLGGTGGILQWMFGFLPGVATMTLTVEAIYKNGVLKPVQPLPLKEQERVQVTVHTASQWVSETAGMIKWKGDHGTLRRLAEDVEFDPQEHL
jgi:predicted DNA-binding antitoxin AbrB/MazE fold protein